MSYKNIYGQIQQPVLFGEYSKIQHIVEHGKAIGYLMFPK